MFYLRVQQPFGRTAVPAQQAIMAGAKSNFWREVLVWWEDLLFHDAQGKLLPRIREILEWGLSRAAVWLVKQVLNWIWSVPALT